MSLGLQD